MRLMRHRLNVRWARLVRVTSLGALAVALWSAAVVAQQGGGGGLGPIATLRGVAVPRPSTLLQYVDDEQALVVLGKALFWDVQLGSDGRTACATCHFHAGADHRLQNQLAMPPGGSGAPAPNRSLTLDEFPFHAFSNPGSNNSPLVRSRRDVVGSQGVVERRFVDVIDGTAFDAGAPPANASGPSLGGLSVRQVTGRNAPSVINAVFNVRNFWDGRASQIFSGSTPFGTADGRAFVLVARAGTLDQEVVRLDNASLASQAVGPPLNGVEMSFDGRGWAHLGRKMLALMPLVRQQVARDDSVLGPFAAADLGLEPELTYETLIRRAFRSVYWRSAVVVDGEGRPVPGADMPAGPDEFSQTAYNFRLFFGLAIQAYESTLVADDSRVDRFLAGETGALSPLEQAGLNEFRGNNSQCTRCHQGAELTAAGVTTATDANASDPRALGLFRIGVSAIDEDRGAAGTDAFGSPLFPAAPGGRANGAFKAPGLRNVELTGPYFHTGGVATLEQVLEFYNRNGDITAGGNLAPGIGNIRLGNQDRTEVAAFLRALTDDRVKFERGPFDHPSLCVPNGHVERAGGGVPDASPDGVPGAAADRWALVPAVGRNGHAVPLQTFQELLTGVGLDGSRAHALERACQP
jgi:cytochrome c peroxidase